MLDLVGEQRPICGEPARYPSFSVGPEAYRRESIPRATREPIALRRRGPTAWELPQPVRAETQRALGSPGTIAGLSWPIAVVEEERVERGAGRLRMGEQRTFAG